MQPEELKKMIADHMEKGFLENIIDMFRHDSSLYSYVGELMTDERVRVRLGITALVETLKKEDPCNISLAVSGITHLLKNNEPVIRGDAAYLLGIIGQGSSVEALSSLAENDESEAVRLIAKEAVDDIMAGHSI